MYTQLKERIKEHEGFRNTVYSDSLGFATIGYGHLVLPTDNFVEGVEYSEEELNNVFEVDFNTAEKDATQLIEEHEVELNHNAKCVIIEMCFQLGKPRVKLFKKMWAALQIKDFGEASFQMMDSRWAKQTPSRAESLAKIMRASNEV